MSGGGEDEGERRSGEYGDRWMSVVWPCNGCRFVGDAYVAYVGVDDS